MSDETRGERSPRQLQRSRTEKVIAGVCGGIGQYFGVDPVLVRIAFVVLAIAGGSGLLLYLVAWILMPQAREGDETAVAPRRERTEDVRLLAGAVLIALGGMLLLGQLIPRFGRIFWPMVLVALGIAVLVGASRR
jgi:phage shock protein C